MCAFPKIFLILLVVIIFMFSTTIDGQEEAKDPAIPDFTDGSWLALHRTNADITITVSPTEKWIFTIGVIQLYAQIGNPLQAGEFMPIHDPTHAIYKIWIHQKVQHYALLVQDTWHLGTALHIHVNHDPERGRWKDIFLSVTPSGPVRKWQTAVIKNPSFSLPPIPAPPSPAIPGFPLRSGKPQGA